MKKLLIKIEYFLIGLGGAIPPSHQIEDKFGFRVRRYKTIYVKKGKIREYRTYDLNNNRITPVLK